MKTERVSSLFALTCVVALSASTASAAPVGHFDTGICAGGGVTVNATSIDWLLPAGGGFGCIVTGSTTNVSYTGGGPLVSGVQGQIRDLIAGDPFPVIDFMTFTGNPNLHVDLNSLGPGVANTICAGLLIGQSCSVFTGSPFILTSTGNGTSVTLSAFGTARDLSAGTAAWIGAFTTQLANLTPAGIQAIILAGGSVTSTHSGDFVLRTIPEPLSMVMLGLGLIGIALRARKRQAK